MKKLNAKGKVILTACVLILFTIAGVCWYVFGFAGKNEEGTKLSMETIIEMSQRENVLTWGDFEQYEHTDVGSGLWIERYEIAGEPDYCLLVGGALLGTDVEPLYIYLIKMSDRRPGLIPNSEVQIEIREEDVEEFLKEQGVLP